MVLKFLCLLLCISINVLHAPATVVERVKLTSDVSAKVVEIEKQYAGLMQGLLETLNEYPEFQNKKEKLISNVDTWLQDTCVANGVDITLIKRTKDV